MEYPSIKNEKQKIKLRDVGPSKHALARECLLGVLFVLVLSGVASLYGGQKGSIIFDKCITVLPPIATLILGYFFSKK